MYLCGSMYGRNVGFREHAMLVRIPSSGESSNYQLSHGVSKEGVN